MEEDQTCGGRLEFVVQREAWSSDLSTITFLEMRRNNIEIEGKDLPGLPMVQSFNGQQVRTINCHMIRMTGTSCSQFLHRVHQ